MVTLSRGASIVQAARFWKRLGRTSAQQIAAKVKHNRVRFMGQSGFEFADHLAAKLAELAKTAGVEVSQFGVFESEQIEDRHMNVAQRVDDFNGFLSDFVGGAHNLAAA